MVRDNRSTFAKSVENIAKRFEREVFKIYDADGSCKLEEATRQARLEHPAFPCPPGLEAARWVRIPWHWKCGARPASWCWNDADRPTVLEAKGRLGPC